MISRASWKVKFVPVSFLKALLKGLLNLELA